MKAFLGWAWYVLMQLVGIPLFVGGLVIVGIAAWRNAITDKPAQDSIKPLLNYHRFTVDRWIWPINAVYGNPEDGVSGIDAYGGDWGSGPFNGTTPPSRWKAFVWSGIRNWAAGFNYISWPFASPPPFYQSPTNSGRKFGWQSLPASDGWVGPYKYRMVFDL